MTALTAELASLLPCLDGALIRDNTTDGRGGFAAGIPVNGNVLHALVMLHREVPATATAAAELLGERWQSRRLTVCLTAIPRFADRMAATGHGADALALEDHVRRWTRVTKQALGLRTPDIPLGCTCPSCAEGRLFAAGSEGFLRHSTDGITVEWEHAGRVYCTVCTAVWTIGQWAHLGRLLEAV